MRQGRFERWQKVRVRVSYLGLPLLQAREFVSTRIRLSLFYSIVVELYCNVPAVRNHNNSSYRKPRSLCHLPCRAALFRHYQTILNKELPSFLAPNISNRIFRRTESTLQIPPVRPKTLSPSTSRPSAPYSLGNPPSDVWKSIAQKLDAGKLHEALVEWKASGWKNRPDRFLEEDQLVTLGELLIAYLERAPPGEKRALAEEAAIWLAGSKRHYPLAVALGYHLQRGDTTPIFDLLGRYEKANPTHITTCKSLPTTSKYDVDPQTLKDFRQRYPRNSKLGERLPPYHELYFHLFTAYVILDDYLGALNCYLTYELPLTPETLSYFIGRMIPVDKTILRKRLVTYADRVTFAKQFAHSHGLVSKLKPHVKMRNSRQIMENAMRTLAATDEGWLKMELVSTQNLDLTESEMAGIFPDEEILGDGRDQQQAFTEQALIKEEAKSNPEYPHLVTVPCVTHRHWITYLHALLNSGATEDARRLWGMLEERKFQFMPAMWSTWLDGLMRTNQFGELSGVVNMMHKRKIEPDIVGYLALMLLSFHLNHIDRAMQILHQIRELVGPQETWGHTPFVPRAGLVLRTYNEAFRMLFKRQMIREANALLEELETKGPAPDIVTYNTFLRRHARGGDQVNFARLLSHIENHPTVRPDIYTFAVLFSATKATGRSDRVAILLDRMKTAGIEPNTVILSTLIDITLGGESHPLIFDAVEDSHSYEEALLILQHMEDSRDNGKNKGRGPSKKNIEPSEITYGVFLGHLLRSHKQRIIDERVLLERLRVIIRGLRHKNAMPNRVTLHLLMNIYLRCKHEGALDRAMKIYRELKERNLPRNDTYYFLLSNLYNRNELLLARQVIREMEAAEFQPRAALHSLVARIKTGYSRQLHGMH